MEKNIEPMKIMHVLTSARAEGTPRLVLDWLDQTVYRQHVLFLEDGDFELDNIFKEKALSVKKNSALKPGIQKVYQIIRFVEKEVMSIQPDVVISWNTGFSSWVLLGAKKAGCKKLIAHGGNPARLESIKQKFYSAVIFGINKLLGTKVICCSAYVQNSYKQYWFHPQSIFYYTYNCIDVSKFTPTKQTKTKDTARATMVATLELHKDHKTLMDAWLILEKNGVNIELYIVGNGQLRSELEDYSKRIGLTNTVFAGTMKNIPKVLEESDIFVFSTTEQEGFGTVLIEALAMELPIVASDVTACSEVLRGGLYGRLVPPANAHLLAEAIVETLKNKINYDSQKGRDYACSFTTEKMIAGYLDIIKK